MEWLLVLLARRSSDKYVALKCHWEYLNVVFDFLFTYALSPFTFTSYLARSRLFRPPAGRHYKNNGKSVNRLIFPLKGHQWLSASEFFVVYRFWHAGADWHITVRRIKIKTKSKTIAAVNLGLHSYGVKNAPQQWNV